MLPQQRKDSRILCFFDIYRHILKFFQDMPAADSESSVLKTTCKATVGVES